MFRHRRLRIGSVAVMAVSLALGSLGRGASAAPGLTERVSISSTGQQGNNISGRFAGPAISSDGQVVAFDSIATTLVPNDRNMEADVFVRERTTDTTERVSVSSSGGQANDFSSRPALDGSGNLVAFDSGATNLVPGDTNSALDVFVHDRTTGTTERISVSSDEEQGNAGSFSPSVSADGRFVSFTSDATNLIPGGTSGVRDVFVRDLVAGTTEVVSVSSTGEHSNSSSGVSAISADGRWVAFSSFATNLVPGDTNGLFDVFIHDRQTGLTELVSVSSEEEQGDAQSTLPSVSGDGQLVAFTSDATNLVPGDTNDREDIFVRDRTAGTTERISVSSDEQQADGDSQHPGVRGFTASGPDITADGRFVTFYAAATNLVAGDTNTCPLVFDEPGTCPDVFVRDRLEGTTERWSEASDGSQANDRSADPVISDDGSTVAFFSAAGNLVPDDTNVCPPIFFDFPGQCPDIFVHEQGGPSSENADLSVTKSDVQDPSKVNRRITYKIEVTNDGPALATEVTITDVLPDGVQFLSATSSVGSCAKQGARVECELGTLGGGGTAIVTIEVRPLIAGTVTNRVTVTAAEPDPLSSNNKDLETTRVLPA